MNISRTLSAPIFLWKNLLIVIQTKVAWDTLFVNKNNVKDFEFLMRLVLCLVVMPISLQKINQQPTLRLLVPDESALIHSSILLPIGAKASRWSSQSRLVHLWL